VSLRTVARLGDRVEKGQELCRLYVRAPRPDDAATARACFRLVDSPPPAPALIEALAI
jgi:hypothetical protein